MLKGFSALVALDQHELLMKNQQNVIAQAENIPNDVLEMSPKEPPSKKMDSGDSE
jgi:hypothetical protein